MTEPIYKLNRLLSGVRKGSTRPQNGRLNAILKRDSSEFPYCVYCEQAAVRLAQVLRVPVADGVLTRVEETVVFASLEVAAPAIPLPDLLTSQFAAAARRYPWEAAGLALFDILIGNWDRLENLKASIKSEVSLFRGFDHSHVLLECKGTIQESLDALRSLDLIVRHHPFYGLVDKGNLKDWLQRFALVSEEQVRECCQMGRALGPVDEELQASLADSVAWRSRHLPEIIENNMPLICPEP